VATIYYTAASLDGFIVDDGGSLDWLLTRSIDQDGQFGYRTFIANVGALVMGSTTYRWLVDHQPGDWMYDQPTWVLTQRPDTVLPDHPVTVFGGDVADLHPRLRSAAGNRDIWVVGGGNTAAQFVSADLIDEMVISYAPCSLGSGTPVLPVASEWTLADAGVNGEFLCARWRFGPATNS
jgi:dihydrofolate reductase